MKETPPFDSPPGYPNWPLPWLQDGYLDARRDWERPLTEFATIAIKKGAKE